MVGRTGMCLFLLIFSTTTWAIDATVVHSLFYARDTVRKGDYDPSLEICWQVNPRSLHFVTTQEKKIVARIKTDIVLTNDAGIIKEDHFILQTNPRSNTDELASMSILELRRYAVSAGLVRVTVMLTDLNDTTNTFIYRDSINCIQELRKPFYSDLQLLDTFLRSDAKTPFLKNGRQHLPLCADFLDDNKRTLHYYSELYRIETVAKDQYPLVQKVRISKKENEGYLPEMIVSDTIFTPRTPLILGSIPIGKLISGNYFVVATLEDKTGAVLASASRFFQRLNIHPEKQIVQSKPIKELFNDTAMEHVTVLNLEKTFLAKYTLAQIKAMLKMLLPVSDPVQTNTITGFLKKPDEMYMRYYIYNYFQAINAKDPAAAWKEYSDKVKEVNRKFTSQGTAGYETERGFLYLRYGAPTDIVTVTNETGALPYEIWQYNVLTQFGNKKELANSLFLFYKPAQMLSEYRLLHSTVPGEIMNASWRMYLYATSNSSTSAGSNPNSRAEQYFGNR